MAGARYMATSEALDSFEGTDLRALGITSEEDYLAAYCRRTGRGGVEDWGFYVGFAMFRLAAIAQGIMGRVLAGTANDPNARQRGAQRTEVANQGRAGCHGGLLQTSFIHSLPDWVLLPLLPKVVAEAFEPQLLSVQLPLVAKVRTFNLALR